jgi:uncharacterized protein YndB with AHSA1/START domain
MTDTNRTSAEGDFGVVLDAQSVRFVRDLPGPIERVWEYLTQSDLREKWLYGGEIPHEPGAEFGRFSWEGEGGEPGGSFHFVVRVYEAPRVLEYDWIEASAPEGIKTSHVRFELEPVGERVRLTLTHRAIAPDAFQSIAAGWHAHLDTLRAVLDGVDGPDANARYEPLLAQYAARRPSGG